MKLIFSIVIICVCVYLGKQAQTTSTTKATTKTTLKPTTTVPKTAKTIPTTTTLSPINLNNIMQKLSELESKLDRINSCVCTNKNSTTTTPLTSTLSSSFPSTKFPTSPIPNCMNSSSYQYGSLKQVFSTYSSLNSSQNFIFEISELSNGNLAIASWRDARIRICNISTFLCNITISLQSNCSYGLNQIVILSNGNIAASLSDLYCSNHSITIWDSKSGIMVNNISINSTVNYMLPLLDGSLLIRTSSQILMIINPLNGAILMTKGLNSQLSGRFILLPNGNIIMGNFGTPNLEIMDTKNLNVIQTLSTNMINTTRTITYNLDMRLLPNGLLATTSNTQIYLWDLNNGTLIGSIDFDYYFTPFLSVLSNGYLALANKENVNIYDLKSKSVVKIISDTQNNTFNTFGITAITTLSNGNLVTSNSNSLSDTVKIWNTATTC